MYKAIVLYESSGVMREALRKVGIEAYSCDLQPADDASPYHYQCDALETLDRQQYDVVIAHPTCTKVCVSGNHVYARGKPKHHERLQAIEYIEQVWHKARTRHNIVILENPIGVLTTSSCLPKPQIVQPYLFGEDASKATCLFLHGIDHVPIWPWERHDGRIVQHQGKRRERWSNQTDSGQNRLGPSEDRWKVRSRTYPRLASAVAYHIASNIDPTNHWRTL